MKRLLLLWILAITPEIGSAVVVYQQNFDSGALGPNLNISATSGFSYDLNGGALNMHMGAGSPKGSISASSAFQVVGDFTATVDVTLTNLANALGIGAYRSGGGGANLFFWGSSRVLVSNIFLVLLCHISGCFMSMLIVSLSCCFIRSIYDVLVKFLPPCKGL